MPYLLTPEAKSRILHGEAAMEQQQHLSAAAMQVWPWGAGGWAWEAAARGGAPSSTLHAQPPAHAAAGPSTWHARPPLLPAHPLRQAMFQGVSPSSVAFLSIRVRRGHIVEDALNQVRMAGQA